MASKASLQTFVVNKMASTSRGVDKRQITNQRDIREFDRTIERAPWVDRSAPDRDLIRNEEENIDKTLPANIHRQQEKDRCKAPQNQLASELIHHGLLPESTPIDWNLTSTRRGDKEVWTSRVFIGEHLCGTEDRQWGTQADAKLATALKALAFLEVGSYPSVRVRIMLICHCIATENRTSQL